MATTKVKVRQVVGDGVYDCELKGISADQIDSTTVNAIFRSFNETARDDSDLTDEQAATMRFVPEGELEEDRNLFKNEPSSQIAGRVKEIADRVEEELRQDEIINTIDDDVIGSCVRRQEGTDETDSPPSVDYGQVKDHLMKVFGHLLSREELIQSSPMTVIIRFASGIAYCYNFIKKILLRALHSFIPTTVVDMICCIASFFMQHLIAIGFDRITKDLGGWTQLAGSLALTKALSVVTERIGTSKYFFGAAAVASAGIALYLHFYGS